MSRMTAVGDSDRKTRIANLTATHWTPISCRLLAVDRMPDECMWLGGPPPLEVGEAMIIAGSIIVLVRSAVRIR